MTALILLTGLWLAGHALAQDAPVLTTEQRLDELENLYRDRGQLDGTLSALQALRDDGTPAVEQRRRAGTLMVQARMYHRQWDEAVTLARGLREALPADAAAQRAGWLGEIDALRNWNKREAGVDSAEAAIEALAGDPSAVASARVRLADCLRRLDRDEEAWQQAHDALADLSGDGERAWARKLMAWSAGDLRDDARAIEAIGPLLAEPLWAHVPGHEQRDLAIRYGDALVRSDRAGDALAHYCRLESAQSNARQAQEYALYAGRALRAAGRHEEALEALERVFLDYPGEVDGWKSAQREIVAVRLAQGDLAGALGDARLCVDAADNGGEFTDRVRLVADILRRLDGHLARANGYILFQRHGPAGEDGEGGTDDDRTDPLAELARPQYPAREQAFAAEHARRGDRASASRYRGLACVYAGRGGEALEWYLDAFRRAPMNEIETVGRELVLIGVRARQGHPIGLERFFAYLNHGPAGPDGEAGSEDDLPDPFAPLAEPAPEAGQGGANSYDAQTLDQLRRLGDAVSALAMDVREPASARRDATRAMERLHQAMDDWGGPGQVERYSVALQQPGLWDDLQDQFARLAVAAARGRQIHLAGARAFWQDYDARRAALDQPPPNRADYVRQQFGRILYWFEPGRLSLRAPDPLSIRPAGLDLNRLAPLQ